ncbi:MAG: hypothetical protein CMM93_09275 [Rickettsiales bacterium]|nr:hypothetical protein [Rickettsiales bacterium]
MTPGAVGGGKDGRDVLVGVLEPLVGGLPAHRGDLLDGAEVLARVAVTLEAPLHGDRLVDTHDLHLVDATVAALAADGDADLFTVRPLAGEGAVEVGRVVEVGVVGQLMDADPLHRLTGLPALANRSEAGGLGAHDVVAAHAGLRGRDHRLGRLLHVRVAVAAVEAELPRVQAVAIRHRLLGRVSHLQVAGREVDPDDEDEPYPGHGAHSCEHHGQEVQLSRKYLHLDAR